MLASPKHSGKSNREYWENRQSVSCEIDKDEAVHTEPKEHDASEASQDNGHYDMLFHLSVVFQDDRQVDESHNTGPRGVQGETINWEPLDSNKIASPQKAFDDSKLVDSVVEQRQRDKEAKCCGGNES